jgi:hypothetical protein
VYAGGASALDASADELDGQFALARYRAADGELELLSDPFGLQALYLARREGLAYASTSVLALAKHLRASPDRLGLEVFLRSGPHFGSLTCWEGIRRAEPATVESYGPTGCTRREYWRPAIDPAISAMPLGGAARACVTVAADAFRERFAPAGEAWCDLTGGYDTRLAALLLARGGACFRATTNGAAEDPDATLAARIAAAADWPWVRAELNGTWPGICEHRFQRALGWGDGTLEMTQLAGVLELQGDRARDAGALFNGGGGEHWRDYAWKQEIPFGGRRTKVNFDRWVSVRFLHPIDTSVFRSDPTPCVRSNLIERCIARAAPYADELNSVKLDVLYAYKSMAHFGAYQSASRGTIRVELPFYAKPAFAVAFSVAPRHRNSHRLARAALELLDPRIAALRTTHGDLATPMRVRNAHRFAPFFAERARGAARKLTQNLPGPTLGALSGSTPQSVTVARQRALDQFIDATGASPARMRSGALYEAHALQRLAHSSAATSNGWSTLGRIITAERALEVVDAVLE